MDNNLLPIDLEPESIILIETYTYTGELSSNDYIKQQNEPTGEISLLYKFDGKEILKQLENRSTSARIQRGFRDKPESAIVGKLRFENYHKTDIDNFSQLKRKGDRGHINLEIPIKNRLPEWEEDSTHRRVVCELDSHYTPHSPENYPVKIKAEIVNVNAYHNELILEALFSKNDLASISKIIRNTNEWDEPFAIKVSIEILLSGRAKAYCPDMLDIDAFMALEWEVNQSVSDVEFYRELDSDPVSWVTHIANNADAGNDENIDNDDYYPKLERIPSYFIPTEEVVGGKLKVEKVKGEWKDGLEAMAYYLPDVFMLVRRPSLLFNKKKRSFNVTLEILSELLSGVEIKYLPNLNGVREGGKESNDQPICFKKSIIKLHQRLQLTDYFERRTFILFEKLFFSGLILGEDEILQIRNEFVERGFKCTQANELKTSTLEDSKVDEVSRSTFMIIGNKTVGADTLDIWVVLEGRIKRIERTFMDNGIQHKSQTQAGDTQIFIRASLKREQVELIKNIKEIVVRLKDLFRHLEVQR